MTEPSPAIVPIDKRARDARIRELDKAGWNNVEIGAEVGISPQRVGQILDQADPYVALTEHEAKLQVELDELLRHEAQNRRRIRAVRRALERIDQEREDQRIDQLLGLA